MLLAIDVGNTHICFGVYDGTTAVADFRLATDHRRTEDEYAVWLRELMHDAGLEVDQVDAVVLASVVPPLTEVLKGMSVRRFGHDPLVIAPGVKTGMPVLYDHPREVGADRIVNGVAAYERFRAEPGGPHGVIVVDFGTATTFDVVSPRGEYLGGAISPGIAISTEALFRHAAKLPRVDLVLPPSAIGKSTVASMQAGILYGYSGLVDGMVRRMRVELDYEPRVIATGGMANLLSEISETIEVVDAFLTLDGLRIIYARNHPGAKR